MGIANSLNTGAVIALGGTLTTAAAHTLSGAFASTFTFTGISSVTFPTSGTLATTAQLPTPAALTKTDDANVTLTLGGTPTTALLQATSLTLGWSGQLALTRGGSNASLTAANGGVVYSTASALAILAPTVTAMQMLQSGASGAPNWSTATYPATTTANRLLYSSSTNNVVDLATANSAALVTTNAGVPVYSSTMTNGQIIIGSTSGTPVAATLTQGTGVTITNGAGTITIATSATGTVTSVGVSSSTGLIIGSTPVTTSGTITVNLPNSSAGNNLLYNGGMQLWQRGTTFSLSGTATYIYTADRWQCGTSVTNTMTFTQQPGNTSGSFRLRVQRSNGTTGVYTMAASQTLTRDMSLGAQGQALTLSFNARCGANFSPTSSVMTASVYCGFGSTDVSVLSTGFSGGNTLIGQLTTNLTTSIQSFSVTTSVANASITQLGIIFDCGGNATSGLNDWFEIENIKLEISPSATAFVPVSLGVETPRCERFFQLVAAAAGIATSTTTVELSIQLHNAMRAIPTISSSGVLVITNGVSNFGQSSFAGSSLFSYTGGGLIFLNNFTGLVMTTFYQLNTNSNPVLYMVAELT